MHRSQYRECVSRILWLVEVSVRPYVSNRNCTRCLLGAWDSPEMKESGKSFDSRGWKPYLWGVAAGVALDLFVAIVSVATYSNPLPPGDRHSVIETRAW